MRKCASPATRFNTMPAKRSSESKVSNPRMTAAMLRALFPASTTRATGKPSSLAIWAVLPSSELPVTPSKSPIIPSTTATSQLAEAREKISRLASASSIQVSRLRTGRFAATARWPPSMKSGPHLKGCTVKPRDRSAAMMARATVVLPAPLAVPATTNAFTGAPRQFL